MREFVLKLDPLLEGAFESRLVDQYPSDESASVLLDPIRAEYEKVTPKPSMRPTRESK